MATEETTHLAVERQRIILDILRREGVVRNAELTEMLKVSTVTIRNDLRELEKAGQCEIIWGGALSASPAREPESLLSERSRLHAEAKQRIGAKAAELIEPGQTIILDAGSTVVELVHHLPKNMEYLRVVTPALNVAVATTNFPYIELVMTGGVLRDLTRSLVGSQTLRALETFNADYTFLATGGFALEHGITTSNIMEIEVKKTMMQQAQQVVLMADSSKFDHVRSLTVAPLSSVHTLITDTNLSDQNAQQIEALGVQVWRV